jgi:O-antigen/teichoic acid export membrane protein
MRTRSSLINIAASLVLGFVAIIMGFIAQKYFVSTLGIEFLGLNGLFTNIITMLSLAELGLGASVVYHLYRPLQEKDDTKVSSIMSFYKTGYRFIALIVFALGMLILPFLTLIVGENSLQINIYLVYALFIGNVVVSYLLSYKRSILYADQKNYLVNIIHLVALLILNLLQIWILMSTMNYYLYLLLKITMTMAENIIINKIVDRRYNLQAFAAPLDIETKKDIYTKIKGLFYHKIGDFLVLGSTNIIISVLLGMTMVGLFSNYYLIQAALTLLFAQMSAALTASIGNLLLSNDKKKHYTIFRRLHFANQTSAVVCTSVFLVASNSIISWWLGSEYTFNLGIVVALSLNIYLILIRSVFWNFKQAAGIFYEDRFVPLFESLINIVVSIILIHFMGIAGAFIGTAVSSLALHAYSYPKFIYKGVLGRSYREYILQFLRDLSVASVIITTVYFTSTLVVVASPLGQMISDGIVAVAVPVVLLWIIYRKTDEFIYFTDLLLKISYKIKFLNTTLRYETKQ